jgi:cellulose synthase/poly-beta-1,6-N-acetylglucosamine synthase-like glycosyltransferase
MRIGVIIPHVGEPTLAECLRSIDAQTLPAAHVVTVDGRAAGTKAGAQNIAWAAHPELRACDVVVTVDADTILHPNYLRAVSGAFTDRRVVAASGAVLGWNPSTLWQRGRAAEYLTGFHLPRLIQRAMGISLVASGCCGAWRVTWLARQRGPWSEKTLGEDMDMTWAAQVEGAKVVYVPQAACSTIDPLTGPAMLTQLRRWSTGFLQCLRTYGPRLRPVHGLWVVLALVYAYLLPFLFVLTVVKWPVQAITADLITLAIPVLIGAKVRGIPLVTAASWIPAMYFTRVLVVVAAYAALIRPSRRWA